MLLVPLHEMAADKIFRGVDGGVREHNGTPMLTFAKFKRPIF